MISCSSSLASSTPATSLKVTFFCWLVSSRARLLPNDIALLPPACICRMKKIHRPSSRIMGRQFATQVIQEPAGIVLDEDVDVFLLQTFVEVG